MPDIGAQAGQRWSQAQIHLAANQAAARTALEALLAEDPDHTGAARIVQSRVPEAAEHVLRAARRIIRLACEAAGEIPREGARFR